MRLQLLLRDLEVLGPHDDDDADDDDYDDYVSIDIEFISESLCLASDFCNETFPKFE